MGYIKANNLEKFQHIQIPKNIWNMFLNKKISTPAFKIYVEFFERIKLSSYNNWIDEAGNVYIKYSYEELMKILDTKSKGTIAEALKELKELGLIIQEKGFNTTSKYYLSNILEENFIENNFKEEVTEIKEDKISKNNLEEKEVLKQDLQKSSFMDYQKSSFIDSNNNNFNNNNLNITHKGECPPLIHQILEKYKSLGLPKYEYEPSITNIMECYNFFGVQKLFEALEIMANSEFCRNNLSVNSIFKKENLQKALNGSFKNRVKRKNTGIIAIERLEDIKYEDTKTNELLEKMGW